MDEEIAVISLRGLSLVPKPEYQCSFGLKMIKAGLVKLQQFYYARKNCLNKLLQFG